MLKYSTDLNVYVKNKPLRHLIGGLIRMMFYFLGALFAIAFCTGQAVDDSGCSGFLDDLGIEDIGNLDIVLDA